MTSDPLHSLPILACNHCSKTFSGCVGLADHLQAFHRAVSFSYLKVFNTEVESKIMESMK